MVGILIVTHGDFGRALVSSSQLIMGESENLDSLGLYHGDSTDELKLKIEEKIIQLNSQVENGGVLVLADLFGGSPSNAIASAIYALQDSIDVECITGVNLPMLLEVASQKEYQDLKNLTQLAVETGKLSVSNLKERIGM